MEESDSPGEGFKVVDRRRRDAEPDPAPRPPKVDIPPRAPEPIPPAEPAGAAAWDTPEAPDLTSLFLMLASSALVHLGEAADPATREMRKDLGQAQYAIDLLLLLREKTEGNRTQEETRLLSEILHDLQMRFLRAVNQP